MFLRVLYLNGKCITILRLHGQRKRRDSGGVSDYLSRNDRVSSMKRQERTSVGERGVISIGPKTENTITTKMKRNMKMIHI